MARLAFLGTPEVAVLTLEGLLDAGHEIVLVITQPDARRGRGTKVTPCPVKRAAEDHGIPVSHSLEDLASVEVDAGIVVAYGKIIPDEILDSVLLINLHFSLLPRWRGAAPLERAILAGDEETGVCIMKIASELDSGAVYATYVTDVADKTLIELRHELGEQGTLLLCRLLENGVDGLPEPIAQKGEGTYAAKISKETFALDFNRPTDEILRVIRLGQAFCFLGNRRLRVLNAEEWVEGDKSGSSEHDPGVLDGALAATANGLIRLKQVQPESGRVMDVESWSRGLGNTGPQRLSAAPEP